jgi:lipopolysaccharide transport system ATP-binding protein
VTEPSISIEHISKRYRIGAARNDYPTLRDRLTGAFRRESREETTLWALRDITFDIASGEALGLIGHNGAGKSTLLKILSRITEPTEGRVILRGRVASLLEVGTGFHPELTGRENIFLNGAILGMSRAEIIRNFDAIVAFAEVERFLETPVKRYSSGMYVRLAFAIAAHLTPEILLVDEVLAVGDIEFQRRCLGRMNEVARSGRTVVFVSHNLASIESLCSHAVLLERGGIEVQGSAREVIAHYLSRGGEVLPSVDLRTVPNREGSGHATITRLEIMDAAGQNILDQVGFRESFRIRMHYETTEPVRSPTAGLAVLDDQGERVFMTNTLETGVVIDAINGEGSIDCVINNPNILPGSYRLELWITEVLGQSFADHLFNVHGFDVVVGEWRGGSVADLSYDRRGVIYLDCEWALDPR